MTSSDIIATCSVIVAVLAFFATGWQAWLAHHHNRLSVRPLLVWHIARENSTSGLTLTYVLKNLGLGPAVIKDRYFTKDALRFSAPAIGIDEVNAFVDYVLAGKIKYELKKHGLPGRDSAIPSQSEIEIGVLFFPALTLDKFLNLEELAGDVDFHVDYESLYREKFMFSANKGNSN